MNEWDKTHEWEKTHSIEHGWRVVGELVFKGLPMALLCNPTRFMPWCVQYAGSGHYFKTRHEAEEWAYNRRNGRNKSTVMKNVVYASERADVVHAHWAFKGTAYGCSNCGNGVIAPIARYCEECGAKMDLDAGWPIVKGVAPDRVDVVRCQDCRYAEYADSANPVCGMYYGAGGYDFYCADGERRDECEMD